MNQLTADAIPFPFQLPALKWCVLQLARLQGAGQEKGIGPGGAILAMAGCCGESGECFGTGCETTHQPMCHQRLIQFCAARKRSSDQPGGDAHPEAAAEQLVHQQQLIRRQAPPAGLHRFGLLLSLKGCQNRESLVHPLGQGLLEARAGGMRVDWLIWALLPHQGNRFC